MFKGLLYHNIENVVQKKYQNWWRMHQIWFLTLYGSCSIKASFLLTTIPFHCQSQWVQSRNFSDFILVVVTHSLGSNQSIHTEKVSNFPQILLWNSHLKTIWNFCLVQSITSGCGQVYIKLELLAPCQWRSDPDPHAYKLIIILQYDVPILMTDGRTLPSTLSPSFAVDNRHTDNSQIWLLFKRFVPDGKYV